MKDVVDIKSFKVRIIRMFYNNIYFINRIYFAQTPEFRRKLMASVEDVNSLETSINQFPIEILLRKLQ